ncbi:MAG: GNAT family N-acetyltransferase [Ruminiclostridium sp.]
MEFITEKERIICLEKGEQVGEVTFPEISAGVFDINHTFVDPSMQGKGIAAELVRRAIEEIKSKGGKLTASCSYAQRYIEKNNISL